MWQIQKSSERKTLFKQGPHISTKDEGRKGQANGAKENTNPRRAFSTPENLGAY